MFKVRSKSIPATPHEDFNPNKVGFFEVRTNLISGRTI